jgi:hypothetical protein
MRISVWQGPPYKFSKERRLLFLLLGEKVRLRADVILPP